MIQQLQKLGQCCYLIKLYEDGVMLDSPKKSNNNKYNALHTVRSLSALMTSQCNPRICALFNQI